MNTPNTFSDELNNDVHFELNNDEFLRTIENNEFDASSLSLAEINQFIENIDNQ